MSSIFLLKRGFIMCIYCEQAVTWYNDGVNPIYASFLTHDADGWHVDCEDGINGTLSAPIEFCPKCGEKLPPEGRGF